MPVVAFVIGSSRIRIGGVDLVECSELVPEQARFLRQVDSCMTSNWDDPKVEAKWLAGQRANVSRYLETEGIVHGGVPTRAQWFVAPYLSLWPIASAATPDVTGWWVISGDLPTDYLSSKDARDARSALRAFADRWQEASAQLLRGRQPSGFRIGRNLESAQMRQELGQLLRGRTLAIREWVADDDLW